MARGPLGSLLEDIRRLYEDGAIGCQSDAQLLERFRSLGDRAAFEALVGRHGRMVLAVCREVLGDPDDAEDAFQATFLLLARKAGSLRVGRTLAGWLHRVAALRVMEWFQKQLNPRTKLRVVGSPDEADLILQGTINTSRKPLPD